MQKSQIQQRFNRAKETYTKNALIQQKMQENLIALLTKHFVSQNLGNILELGCGDGLLAQKMLALFDFESYLAIDLVDFSKNFARIQEKTGGKIAFLQRDFEDLTQINNALLNLKYDLILSNAAIQWSNQRVFLPKLTNLLYNNGILAFSTFGKANFQELREIFGIGLEYLELKDYEEILSNFKILESFENTIPLHFESAFALFRHLQNIGVNSLQPSFKLHRKHLEEYTKRFCNTLTYNPLYILAQKLESKP